MLTKEIQLQLIEMDLKHTIYDIYNIPYCYQFENNSMCKQYMNIQLDNLELFRSIVNKYFISMFGSEFKLVYTN